MSAARFLWGVFLAFMVAAIVYAAWALTLGSMP